MVLIPLRIDHNDERPSYATWGFVVANAAVHLLTRGPLVEALLPYVLDRKDFAP